MDYTSAQIDRARGLGKGVVKFAGELMLSGADADRTHREYVMKALELLADVEALGLLAVPGDRGSVIAIENQIARLSRLRRDAARQLALYSDSD